MSEPTPAEQYRTNGGALTPPDCLPVKAINLARRAKQLANGGNGRYHLELIVIDGRWHLIVNNGQRLEDLGGE